MKWTGAIARFVAASDCVGRAVGSISQNLLAPDVVWLWWIAAILWGISSAQFAFQD